MLVQRVEVALGAEKLNDAPHRGGAGDGGDHAEDAERPPDGEQRGHRANGRHGQAVAALVGDGVALGHQLGAGGGDASKARLNLGLGEVFHFHTVFDFGPGTRGAG